MKIRQKIFSNVKVKSLQNQKLSGDMYCSIMGSYVKAINEGAVPNIESAWKYMCEEQCAKTYDECREMFEDKISNISMGQPKSEEDFKRIS